MKTLRRIFWGFLAIVVLAVAIISCYGMGQDLLNWLPVFLIKIILGFVGWCAMLVVTGIFIIGGLTIVNWIKRGLNED